MANVFISVVSVSVSRNYREKWNGYSLKRCRAGSATSPRYGKHGGFAQLLDIARKWK